MLISDQNGRRWEPSVLRFTKKADYGLMAVNYIAFHQHKGAVNTKRIAEDLGIPVELLAKILQRLAKRKLITSLNGPKGGYVLAREPDNPTALNFLGYLLADHNRNLQEAVGLIRRALELDPDNGAFLDSLGWAYYRLGRLEDARQLLERAVRVSGGDPVIHEHLGDVYKDLRLNHLAKDQYRLSLSFDQSNRRVRSKLSSIR